MPQIQVITFDLDNTLWDGRAVIRHAERTLAAWLEVHAPRAAALYRKTATVTAMYNELRIEQPHLVHDISRLRQELLYRLLRRARYDGSSARQLSDSAFAAFLEARHEVAFFDGALSALESLSRRYVLGSLTNGNADPKRLKLDRYFSFSFCAADVGAKKPATDMFSKALRHNDAAPSQAVHIGDHPVEDIEAATSLGMHTVWAKGAAQQAPSAAPATEQIEHLDELIPAIERIEQL